MYIAVAVISLLSIWVIYVDEFNVIVGNRIRSLRETNGYSREHLAGLTGISATYLYEIEAGIKNLSAKKMYDLSCSLGVTTDFLIYGELNNDESKIILSLLSGLDKSEIKAIEDIIKNVKIFKH